MPQVHAPTPIARSRHALEPLQELMSRIGNACEGPPERMDRAILAALALAGRVSARLPDHLRQPASGRYARHTVAADPAGRFTLLAIVWGAGQFSPVHAHDTWCAYAVVERPLAETLYRHDPHTDAAVPIREAVRPPGFACFAHGGLEQIHRLGNAGGPPALSLHVYGVDGTRVGTHVNRVMAVAERQG